jgi:hypothetical protein
MCFSVFLALIIGGYATLMSLAFLIHRERYKKMIVEYANNHALMTLSSAIGLILGLLIVTSHNVWVGNWRILITLTGWFLLIKGVVCLFFPEKMTNWAKHVTTTYVYTASMVVWLVIGLYLLAIAFSR